MPDATKWVVSDHVVTAEGRSRGGIKGGSSFLYEHIYYCTLRRASEKFGGRTCGVGFFGCFGGELQDSEA